MEWGHSMKTTAKSSFENFQKQMPFKEIYVIHLEKAGGVYSYRAYFSLVPLCCEINKASDKHLILLKTFN